MEGILISHASIGTMTALVLPLDSSAALLATVGGKGANLSRLKRAGFRVPPGFLITTAAYRAFVEVNDLQTQIVALASDKAKIVEQGRISLEVAMAIQQSYAGLMQTTSGASPVAVRSLAQEGAHAPYIQVQHVSAIPKTASGKAPLVKAYRPTSAT